MISRTQRRQTRASHSSHSTSLTAAQQRLHHVCLREAQRLELVRREETRSGSSLTGTQCISTLLKTDASSRYSVATAPTTPQVSLRASLLDELTVEQTMNMLSALSNEESAFYSEEGNVIDMVGKSQAMFEDLEQQYGFVGGPYSEYCEYFLREDRPSSMWVYTADPADVKATAGFSTVPKKNGRQRKLMMQCSANYYFSDSRTRSNLGMLGGGGMATMYVPGDQCNVASMDESNAFSFVATPRWMWGWCAAPPLRARDLRPVLPSHLQSLPDGAFVWPLYTRLAMGSSHSVHILMDINMTTVGRAMRASSRLRVPPSSAPDPYLEASHSLQLADAAEDFQDCHDYHWEGPLIDPAPDVYEEPLDWNEPAGHKAMSLEQFAAAARAINRDERQRTLVCMHLFSGRRRRFDLEHHLRLHCEKRGIRLLMCSVDLEWDEQWDLGKPSTFHTLMELIHEGCLDALFAGPPCATWSRLRYRPGGPPPPRARGEQSWGLYDLHGFRLKECQVANALMLNTLALLDALASRGGACGMEHPADPGAHPFSSIWATDVMLGLQERRSFVSRTFDQCALGGPCRKPTILTGNLEGLGGEGPFCPGVSSTHIHERSVGRTATGGFLSQRLSLYP